MKITITGKYVNAAQQTQTGSFTKQSVIVEVVNGTYVSYFNVEFHQTDVQNIFPQLVPHGMFNFECWVQGSNKQFTDKNNQPTAYTTLKCVAVSPAQQAAAPQPPAQQFAQPQQSQQGFAPQQTQGFAAPAQAPAPSFAPPAQPGIGAPQGGQTFAPPAPQAPQFAPPQPQAAPAAPAFNPNAGQQ